MDACVYTFVRASIVRRLPLNRAANEGHDDEIGLTWEAKLRGCQKIHLIQNRFFFYFLYTTCCWAAATRRRGNVLALMALAADESFAQQQ